MRAWFLVERLVPFLAIVLAFGGAPLNGSARGAEEAGAPVDFARDIRPLLAARCVKCHGPEKQESGLRLDRRENALVGGDGGAVLVAGKSGESRLWQLVSGTDPDRIMPPAGEGERLSPAELALVRNWIDSGLVWPAEASGSARVQSEHWAYQPISRPEVPQVRSTDWPRNPIDHFVLARLEAEGLAPAAEVEPSGWLRRASLDLTGLPPTLAELDDFALDNGGDRHSRAIERMLDTPAYGEHWARQWLDLARYADTNGYEKDDRRTMWRYRDWVIEAWTGHMPFDQFTIEQMAGDLLPSPTLDQRIATGFHRNTMNNTEGGTDDEEFRVSAVVDRVNTTMTVWMASTMACAQCHTHKYDPFTQREYFQLFAIFNNTADADTNDLAPTIEAPTPEMIAETTRIRGEMGVLKQVLDTQTPELDASQVRWEEAVRAEYSGWQPLEPIEASSESGATLAVQPDRSILASGDAAAQDVYTVTLRVDGAEISGVRLEALPDDSLPDKGPGRTREGNFVLTEIQAASVGTSAENSEPTETKLELKDATAQHSQAKHDVKLAIDGKEDTGWGNSPRTGEANEAVFTLAEPLTLPTGSQLKFRLVQKSAHEKHLLGRFRISITSAKPAPTASPVPLLKRELVLKDRAARSADESAQLASYYRTIAPELAAQRQRYAELEAALPKPPTAPVLVELAQPRETKVHVRGNFLNHGEKVEPQVPEVFHTMPADQPVNRLSFARWLVDRQNPLTARVWVNRIWEQYFGIGLVRTSEDLGTRGEKPSHPELLDWLAVELMEGGWDFRVVHRLILSSATYRQRSIATQELLTRDPENRLFARGPRVRLNAEQIRDQALSISGLLSRKMKGPSVMPPQPDGVWNMPYSSDKWQNAAGEDRYRRALYTFWRRTAPYPAFASFDAPSREICVVRRPRTNTPLQALTVLNDPAYVECAHALAKRALVEPSADADTAARARHAFRLCLAREPLEAELNQLVALWNDARAHYQSDPAGAAKLLSLDAQKESESTANAASPDPIDWAAWTVVANVLLNLDELITKG